MDLKLFGLHSLATVVSARELHRQSEVGAERSITSQWQVPQISIFRDEYALRKIRSSSETNGEKIRVSSWSGQLFERYPRKGVFHGAETDSTYILLTMFYFWIVKNCMFLAVALELFFFLGGGWGSTARVLDPTKPTSN